MMPFKLGTALIAPLLLGVAGIAIAADTGHDQPKSGAALYQRYGCYGCHGYSGAGSSSSGPTVADRSFDAGHVFDYVRRPRGVMPPYHKPSLSDADLQTIANYVVSMHAAVPLARIPQLTRLLPKGATVAGATAAPAAGTADPLGAGLFRTNCAACHGATGAGGIGPSLLDEGHTRSVAQIAALILQPPAKMPKLSPDPIPEAQLRPLAEYVAAFATRPR
jgi:ubiquinol-cytochrome c reductase cytochrome c subunit